MKKSISGIRGIFGSDFNLRDVIKFTDGFAQLVQSGQCIVARDTRESGPVIQEVAIAALNQNGIDTYTLDVAPTPAAFREARKYGAGLVITSSHNPLDWNGLKFILDGRGINQEELETVMSGRAVAYVDAGQERHVESAYVCEASEYLRGTADMPRVLVDLGGSAAKSTAPALLESIGCCVTVINEDVAGSTRGPDPTTDALDDLVRQTKNYDVGFAFDLDGDRLVVVKDGVRYSPDVTLGLGVASAIDMGYDRFVFSIDTSISIEKMVRAAGGTVFRCKVGEANVISEILRTQSHAGGEGSSGGFVLPEFNYCRDGILTSGLVASMSDETFTETIQYMQDYHQIRNKVSVESELHAMLIDRLVDPMCREFSDVTTMDGIKAVADEDTWVLIRSSNTENTIRISAESNDESRAAEIMKTTRALVNTYHDDIK